MKKGRSHDWPFFYSDRRSACKGSALKFGARLDASFCEPAFVHLEHKTYRLGRAMAVQRLRLHLFDIDDNPVVRHERHRQRQQRVFHPETLWCRFVEREQHAVVCPHRFTKHQADGAFFRSLCDLGLNQVHASIQAYRRKLLRPVLSEGLRGAHQGEHDDHCARNETVHIDGRE